MQKYLILPADAVDDRTDENISAPALRNDRWGSNGKRKAIILSAAASAAIVGLGATNIVGALDASAADAAHHRQIVAMNKAHQREIQQTRAQDAYTLLATTEQLRAHERNALAAQKAKDAKDAKAQADRAYANGESSGYSTGYSSGNSAGYSTGYGAGNSDGYSSGYGAGNSDGYSSGYISGSNDGYYNGYSSGYANGTSTVTTPYTGY
jgi:hypothetical protein